MFLALCVKNTCCVFVSRYVAGGEEAAAERGSCRSLLDKAAAVHRKGHGRAHGVSVGAALLLAARDWTRVPQGSCEDWT